MLSLIRRFIPRVLVSPSLARALVVVAWRFGRNRWYLRVAFLPLPARDYVRWRMHTAYGDHDAIPPVDDVIRYARWAARFPRARSVRLNRTAPSPTGSPASSTRDGVPPARRRPSRRRGRVGQARSGTGER